MKRETKRTLTPRLRFPEFRETGEWEAHELGQLTDKVGSGITPLGGDKNYKSSGRPFIRSQNVGWGELILDDVAFIDEETHESFNATELHELDVLLNITGASIGRSAMTDSRVVGGNVNQHVCIIRVIRESLNPALLNQYLISHDGQKQIDSFQAGGNRQGLNFAQIRSFRIPLPPSPAEQRKIAACLGSLDSWIGAESAKLEALRSHKKGLMQQLFPRPGESRPRLRFPEFRDAGEWEEKPLGQVIEIASGQVDPTESPYCDLPHVGGENIESETGNLLGLRSAREDGVISGKYPFDETDVLYSKIRPALNKVALPDFKGICSADIYPIHPSNGDLRRDFLVYLLRSEPFVEYATKHSARGKIPKINREALVAYGARLPTPAEQQRIAACLSSLDAVLAAQSRKVEGLKAHKKGLMQQLFPSGER